MRANSAGGSRPSSRFSGASALNRESFAAPIVPAIVSYVTAEEPHLVAAELRSAGPAAKSGGELAAPPETLPDEHGVFYLLWLELEHDPGRFKVGFAVSLPERLRTLRCSAPFAQVVRTWPCQMLWEKTAIDCVTEGCERLHTEVFRTQSIEPVVQRCEQFFQLDAQALRAASVTPGIVPQFPCRRGTPAVPAPSPNMLSFALLHHFIWRGKAET